MSDGYFVFPLDGRHISHFSNFDGAQHQIETAICLKFGMGLLYSMRSIDWYIICQFLGHKMSTRKKMTLSTYTTRVACCRKAAAPPGGSAARGAAAAVAKIHFNLKMSRNAT